MTDEGFKKEAEEAIKKKYHACVSGYNSLVKNWQEGAKFGYNKCKEELEAQLTKAKEILKGIIDTPMYKQMGGETYENEEYKELITEAEQFLEGAEND